ncbi:TIGR00269 family protein [Candidatus Woesearchaeota archaeon]|nr:TIGR00269 family protein [Candidatus Woesearchaeota archaeon]
MITKNNQFLKNIEKRIGSTIKKFKLFTKNNKIGVAVSGGKDSTVCLYVLKKLGYSPTAITVDAVIGNYTKTNLENIRNICKKYKINLKEISFREEFGHSLCYLKSILKSKNINLQSCALCGVLRKYLLNKYAKKLRLDVLATGHNLDDEAQSFIMNLFRNDISSIKRAGPVTGIGKSRKFVKRVKPLYFIREKETERFSKIMKFPVKYGRCPCSADAFRRNFKDGLWELEKTHPKIITNIIDFYIKNIHKDKNINKNIKINSCKQCGEPSKDNICRACQIIDMLSN